MDGKSRKRRGGKEAETVWVVRAASQSGRAFACVAPWMQAAKREGVQARRRAGASRSLRAA